MVGNNTPIFFIRDTIKFPDFIHSQKRKYVPSLASLPLSSVLFPSKDVSPRRVDWHLCLAFFCPLSHCVHPAEG